MKKKKNNANQHQQINTLHVTINNYEKILTKEDDSTIAIKNYSNKQHLDNKRIHVNTNNKGKYSKEQHKNNTSMQTRKNEKKEFT